MTYTEKNMEQNGNCGAFYRRRFTPALKYRGPLARFYRTVRHIGNCFLIRHMIKVPIVLWCILSGRKMN